MNTVFHQYTNLLSETVFALFILYQYLLFTVCLVTKCVKVAPYCIQYVCKDVYCIISLFFIQNNFNGRLKKKDARHKFFCLKISLKIMYLSSTNYFDNFLYIFVCTETFKVYFVLYLRAWATVFGPNQLPIALPSETPIWANLKKRMDLQQWSGVWHKALLYSTCKLTKPSVHQPIQACTLYNKRSVLRRQSRDTNRNIKRSVYANTDSIV